MRPLLTLILVLSVSMYGAPWVAMASPAPPQEGMSLSRLMEESYFDLFERAPQLNVSKDTLSQWEEELKEQYEREKKELKEKEDRLEERVEEIQDRLEEINRDSAQSFQIEQERHDLHCGLQAARKELKENELALNSGLDVRYDNRFAKLKVLEEWPEKYQDFQKELESGKIMDRKFADFRDVGLRNDVFDDQTDDIDDGRRAIEQLRAEELLPPSIDDPEINRYINRVAGRIARHSDLQVPLKVTVLRSKEVNAFALPGGFLFLNAGLISEAGTEAELAGVIAHEIAHVAARHSDRLGTRAGIADLVLQAAQIAGLIFTGGLTSLSTYYALQYGLYGLGFILTLTLLGVSRDYETEADILGTQYLWHAGYDVTGFIDFFSKMANKEGYIVGASWFRTHPPFYNRMERTYEEILYLPDQQEPVRDSQAFQAARSRLQSIMQEMEQRDREAPTLRRIYHCEEQECAGEYCP